MAVVSRTKQSDRVLIVCKDKTKALFNINRCIKCLCRVIFTIRDDQYGVPRRTCPNCSCNRLGPEFETVYGTGVV